MVAQWGARDVPMQHEHNCDPICSKTVKCAESIEHSGALRAAMCRVHSVQRARSQYMYPPCPNTGQVLVQGLKCTNAGSRRSDKPMLFHSTTEHMLQT